MRARTFEGGTRFIFQFVWLVLLLQLLPFACHRPNLGQKITGKRVWHEHHPRRVSKPDLDYRGVGGMEAKIPLAPGPMPDASNLSRTHSSRVEKPKHTGRTQIRNSGLPRCPFDQKDLRKYTLLSAILQRANSLRICTQNIASLPQSMNSKVYN